MKLLTAKKAIGIAIATPFLLGFTVFYLIPFLYSAVLSLTRGVSVKQFVGIANYIDVYKSEAFVLAFKNTVRFIVIGVPLIMVLAFSLAILLNNKFTGASFFRSVVLFPLVVPIAGTVMFFQVIFASNGVLNNILSVLNLPITDWLNSEYAFSLLVSIYIWKNCGYNIILFLSALNSIPQTFYEVAALEGASKIQIFRKVIFPCVAPTGFFVLVISIINCFKSFREAFMLGGTHPNKSIYMLQHFMNNNFENASYGRISVGAITVFGLIFAIILVLYNIRKKSTIVEV